MTARDSRTSEPPPDAAGRPRRRLWRWILLGVAGVVVVIVLIAPYIASMGPARGLIVGTLNDMLKGSFQLEEASLTWFGPCRLRGLRVADPEGREVLTVGEARLVPGLWGLIWSWENFQWVGVDGTSASLYADAQGNLSIVDAFMLREPGPERPLPVVHGTVHIADASAKVILYNGRTLDVTRVAVDVSVDTLDRLWGNLDAELGDQGALHAKFAVTQLLRDGKMDPFHASVDLDISTPENRDIDLKSVLALVTDRIDFGGKAKLTAKIKGTPMTPEGDFDLGLRGFRAAPPAASEVEAVDLKLTGKFAVTGGPESVSEPLLPDRRTVSGEVTLTGDVGVVNLMASWPYAAPPFTVRLTGEQLTSALLTGDVSMLPRFTFGAAADVDLSRLARAAPALLRVRQDVKVTSGRLSVRDLSVKVPADGAGNPSAGGTVALKDLHAEQAGRSTPLPQLITVVFDGVLEPGKGLRLRDADLSSEFVKIDTTGDVNRVEAVFQADLAGLYGQMNRVFEMGTFELTGSVQGTAAAARLGEDVVRLELKDFTAKDLHYRKDARFLDLESAALTGAGDLHIDRGAPAGAFPLKQAEVTLDQFKAMNLHGGEGKRRLDLASASAAGKADVYFEKPAAGSTLMTLSPDKVVVREGTVEIDSTTSATGSGQWEPRKGAFDATLNVRQADLASLARKAEGLEVALGELARWGGTLEGAEVHVSRTAAGQPLTVSGPGTAALRNLTLDGRPLGVDKVVVTWDGVELGADMNQLSARTLDVDAGVAAVHAADLAAGWGEAASLSGKADAWADVARTLPILARLRGMDAPADFAGRLEWSGEFRSTPPGALAGRTVAVKSTGKIDDFALRTGNAWESVGAVTFSQDTELSLKDGQVERLVVRESRISMPGKLVASGGGSYLHAIGALDADVDVQQADLAYLARLAFGETGKPRPVTALPPAFDAWASRIRRYAGTAQLKGSIKRTASDQPVVTSGTARVKYLLLDGRPLTGRDLSMEWRGAKLAAGGVEAEVLKLDAGVASASAEAFRLTSGKTPQAAGKVQLAADLAAAMPALVRFANIDTKTTGWGAFLMNLAGNLQWSGSFTSAGRTTTFVGSGVIESFRAGTPPDAFTDPKVAFSNDAELNPDTKTLTLRELRVTATPVQVSAAGSVAEYDTRRVLNLRGTFRGRWEQLMPLVVQFVPDVRGKVELSGDAAGSFTVEGPANDPRVKPPWRGVSGVAQAAWGAAKVPAVSDLPLGAATIVVRLKDGVATVPVTEVPVGEGKVRAGAVVDLRTEPPMLYVPGKLQIIENFRFDREFGKKFLNFFNPIFGGNVQGLASVTVQDVSTPLDETFKTKMMGSGRLDLRDLKIESQGFLQQLVGLIGLGSDDGYQVAQTGTDFVIRSGRIYYKDFVIPMRKNFDCIFSGSVGLDDRLDMIVSVPLTPSLLRSHGAGGQADDMARVLTIRVDFAITGTRDAPKVTPQFNPASLIQNALRALMLERLGGLLGPKKN